MPCADKKKNNKKKKKKKKNNNNKKKKKKKKKKNDNNNKNMSIRSELPLFADVVYSNKDSVSGQVEPEQTARMHTPLSCDPHVISSLFQQSLTRYNYKIRYTNNLTGTKPLLKTSRKHAYIILTPLNPTFI